MWLGAFALVFGLSTCWALGTPILSNPDEPAHAVKATALVRGQILPPKVQLPDEGPGSLIRGAFTTRVTVPASYGSQTAKSPECYIWDSRVPAGCAPAWVDDPTETEWTAYIGRYPPVYYAAVGWPTLVDTSAKSLYAMRLASAAVNAALLATAFALTRQVRRLQLVPVALLVAMTPMVVMLNGSVNPNGLEVSAGICAWVALAATVLWRGGRIPPAVLAPVAVSCSLLAVTRPLSTLWLAVIGITVLAVLADPKELVGRLRESGVRTVVAVVGIAGVAGFLWTVFSDDLGNNRGYNPWGLSTVDAIRHSLALSWSYLQQGVAVFGWDRTPSPAPLTWAWGVVLLLLVVPALRLADRRRRIGLLALTAFVFLVPTILQARTAPTFGFVWSGRYGLALFAGIPILAAIVVGSPALISRRTLGAIAGITAAGHVVAHAAAMRRWTVGTDGPLNYLGADGWHPPVPSWLLLGATAALSVGLALYAFHLSAGRFAPGGRDATGVDGAPASPEQLLRSS